MIYGVYTDYVCARLCVCVWQWKRCEKALADCQLEPELNLTLKPKAKAIRSSGIAYVL